MNKEGFYKSSNEPNLPVPIIARGIWDKKEEFLRKLGEKESKVWENHYKGCSTCRICKCKNGSGEFKSGGWIWPSGLSHYVKEHDVVPSAGFQLFILGN